jgi:hypothetical protein
MGLCTYASVVSSGIRGSMKASSARTPSLLMLLRHRLCQGGWPFRQMHVTTLQPQLHIETERGWKHKKPACVNRRKDRGRSAGHAAPYIHIHGRPVPTWSDHTERQTSAAHRHRHTHIYTLTQRSRALFLFLSCALMHSHKHLHTHISHTHTYTNIHASHSYTHTLYLHIYISPSLSRTHIHVPGHTQTHARAY